MYAHFIDVGQGDATLLEFDCGAILIDCGGQNGDTSDDLIEYLDEFFNDRTDLNRTIESIVITHNHVDHTRALREVVEAFTVNRVIHSGLLGSSNRDPGDADIRWLSTNATAQGVTLVEVDDAQITDFNGLTNGDIDPVACSGEDPVIRILSADLAQDPGWASNDFEDKNNHSVVLRVDFGEASFLFTGDLEEPAIATMLEYYEEGSNEDIIDVDVYQVGHHGSYNGTTRELVDAMSPDIAVISMSPSSDTRMWTAYRYGHPRVDAVVMLQREIRRRRTPKWVDVADGVRDFDREYMRDAIFATGWDGTVKVRATSAGRYRVTRNQ